MGSQLHCAEEIHRSDDSTDGNIWTWYFQFGIFDRTTPLFLGHWLWTSWCHVWLPEFSWIFSCAEDRHARSPQFLYNGSCDLCKNQSKERVSETVSANQL